MKKLFVRLLSLALVFALLLPTAVACKEPSQDPPTPPSPPQEGETPVKYIDAVLQSTTETTVADFSSEELKAANPNSVFTFYDGKSVLEHQTSYTQQIITLPETVDISDCHTVVFSVYCENETDAEIYLFLEACSSPATIKADFSGWRDYVLLIDSFSVANPYPLITGIKTYQISGDASAKIYISNIVGIKKNFTLTTPDGVDLADESIYEKIIDNYTTYTFGTEDSRKLSSYQTTLNTIKNNCKKSWDSFKATYKEGMTNGLFGLTMNAVTCDKPQEEYVKWDEEKITTLYENIRNMAKAYACEDATEYYKNPELLRDIKLALEYSYQNFFGQNVIDYGTRGNWWPWDIGAAAGLVPTLVFIREDIDSELVKKYLAPYDHLMPFPVGSAANLADMTYMVILSGALERNAYRIAQAKYLANSLFEYVTFDQMGAGIDGGFFTDGSFIQHSVTPYAGGYGLGLLNTLPGLMYLVYGSYFAFHGDAVNNQFAWIFDTYQGIVYGKNLMSSHCGRGIVGVNTGASEINNFRRLIIYMVNMAFYVPDELRAQYESLLRTYMHNYGASLSDAVSPIFASYATALYKNDEVPLRGEYNITKVYGNMCRIVHHGPEYGACLALSSKRIHKYESINGANFTGWYHGDGMIYLYTDGYEYDTQYFRFANPYLMPGTTVNSAERYSGNIHPTIPNESNFAGGVEQGKYGASGFILGYPSTAPKTTFSDLKAMNISAKKSYFFFDNEIVCVGSDITDETGTTVRTVIENRQWKSDSALHINNTLITDPAYIEYQTPNSGYDNSNWGTKSHPASEFLTSNYRQTIDNVTSMHFSNMGGYVFLRTPESDGNTLTYTKIKIAADPTTGTITTYYNTSGSETFLEITLDHGKGDSTLKGKYCYAYLPDATAEETADYANNADIALLRRTSDCHAVLEKSLSSLGAVFFDDDTLSVSDEYADCTPVKSVTSATGCALMITKGENGEVTVSVSDPTQDLSRIKLTIDMRSSYTLASADDGVTVEANGNTLSVNVSCKENVGNTYSFTLK